MQAIDPTILAMIENGRQAADRQAAEAQALQEEEAAVVRQRWDEQWTALETAVAQLLPEEIAPYAAFPRTEHSLPGLSVIVEINIPHLVSFYVYLQNGNGGWAIYSYEVVSRNVTGNPESSNKFRANELPLCLAAVANQTERQAARDAAVADYQLAVAEWRKAQDEAQATITAMTRYLQQQVCSHYGDRFALWQVYYSYFDEDGDTATGTAVVLENETDALGFWRVVNRMGEVRRIAYSNVYAVEALGDHDVTDRVYTKRLHGDKLGSIYLPPYVTDAELAAAKQMLAEADAAAPDLPKQPRPHEMETAVLFADWELDWLFHHTGGDADK